MSGAEREPEKGFTEVVVMAAMNGWNVWRSNSNDGPQRYFAGRWGQVRVLADLGEVKRFLEQVGVR